LLSAPIPFSDLVVTAVQATFRTTADGAAGTPERRQFGEDGLAEAFAACDGLDATATVTRLAHVLATHSHGWADDDTALLAVRVPPAG
jgi:uncharacterized protein (DUF697 family)